MKFQTRIKRGIAIVVVIGLVLGIAGLVSMQFMTKLSKEQEEVRLSYADAAAVLAAHYEWRQQLTVAAMSGIEFKGSTDHTSCMLGKWLLSDTSRTDDPEVIRLFEELEEPHEYIHQEAALINELIKVGDTEEARHVFEEHILPNTNVTISLIGQLEARYSLLLDEKMNQMARVQIIFTILIGALIVIALISSYILIRRIIKAIMEPIHGLTECAEAVTKGALDVKFEYGIDDEIGQLGEAFIRMTQSMQQQSDMMKKLADSDYTSSIEVRSDKDEVNKSINNMIENTNKVLHAINIAAEQVNTGAYQVSSGAQALAAGSTEQAATIEELSASIALIAEQANENSANVREANEYIDKAAKGIEDGNVHMVQLIDAMRDINTSSAEIASIIKLIEDIAFQTNILALNASVEAARAGSAGKGFAVVADEVRNLAEESAQAAKQTADLIKASGESVSRGNEMTEATSEILKEVGENARYVTSSFVKIEEASAQQTDAIEDIKTGLSDVSAVIQTNAATAEENSAISEEMAAQAETLHDEISRFKLRDGAGIGYRSNSIPKLTQTEEIPQISFSFDNGLNKY